MHFSLFTLLSKNNNSLNIYSNNKARGIPVIVKHVVKLQRNTSSMYNINSDRISFYKFPMIT